MQGSLKCGWTHTRGMSIQDSAEHCHNPGVPREQNELSIPSLTIHYCVRVVAPTTNLSAKRPGGHSEQAFHRTGKLYRKRARAGGRARGSDDSLESCESHLTAQHFEAGGLGAGFMYQLHGE